MKAPFVEQQTLPGWFGKLLFSLMAVLFSLNPALAQDDIRAIVGKNVVHTVKPKETMFTIAQRYGLAVDHLAFANGFNPTSVILDPGTTLIEATSHLAADGVGMSKRYIAELLSIT